MKSAKNRSAKKVTRAESIQQKTRLKQTLFPIFGFLDPKPNDIFFVSDSKQRKSREEGKKKVVLQQKRPNIFLIQANSLLLLTSCCCPKHNNFCLLTWLGGSGGSRNTWAESLNLKRHLHPSQKQEGSSASLSGRAHRGRIRTL